MAVLPLSTSPISTATPLPPPPLPPATLALRNSLFLRPGKTSASPLTRRRPSLSLPRVAAPPTPTSPTTTEQQQQPSDESISDPVAQVEVEDEEESSSSRFSWRDHWYPVSLVEDLDLDLPTPFQLLNLDLVLWFDRSSSQWVAFDDKCPHRLAPLSEGRIDENGHLQCSYHGWSFDGCGSCTRIPQASTEGPEARAVRSPRACATRFPTLVSQGLLFVWPDENGWERSRATKPPMLPDDFEKPEFSTVTIQRDLFYGYDTLMENVSDPSHIDFAHHKVTGRRDRAKPLPFKMESTGPWGFTGSNDDNPKISAKFIAPCYYMNKIEIDTKLPLVGDQKWVIWICSFNVPMAPGKTRSIVCSARNFFQFTMPGPAWWQVVPRWHEHWTSNKVYDGDMIVLQGQEKTFLSKSKEGSADVNKQYATITFIPTQADRFVLAFRNWLRRHGNNQPEWFGTTDQQPLPSTVLSKHQMLDRYEQHTLKCSSCRKAYSTFQTLQKFLLGVVVLCSATAGVPSNMQLRLVLAAVAIISAASAYVIHELEKNFEFVDYIHAEID
ncbi:pheophorbide a oxygenase, chloroplastic [Diospyros lotus]|uniref:pheophorbide a oxygenase, chloroplastic n=1 Tax=Diospyros lotus TaxID=55363 RepID=UPI00224DE809|nr:pheophorbide a oxygenase, chloroplastic [Diospyros lotus]